MSNPHTKAATPSTIKSLGIINEYPGITPTAFARKYFDKNHEGWSRHTKCGHGVRTGGGLILWAGGHLGKLRKAGLINNFHSLTEDGRRMMSEHSSEITQPKTGVRECTQG